jgi:hypothetical protein
VRLTEDWLNGYKYAMGRTQFKFISSPIRRFNNLMKRCYMIYEFS